MDFLNGKIKTIYFKYLAAAFGSALITSIYSIVDMAMVGKYHGPDGSAALAVVMPVWNIIYSLGLLMGIGGSVLFSTTRGKAEGREERSNEYFTASVIGSVILAVIVWLVIIFFDRPLLQMFGAADDLLPLAREYVAPVKFAVPLFLFNQMLAAYLRNDKNPGLATAAVLSGGIFNVFGDFFWTVLSLAAPNLYIHVFMSPTEEVLQIAPSIIRCYCISFLLLPLNIFSTYYFQAIMKPKDDFIVSVARGLVVSGIFIYLLPVVAGADAIWFAMPITELLVAVYVVYKMMQYTRGTAEERKVFA